MASARYPVLHIHFVVIPSTSLETDLKSAGRVDSGRGAGDMVGKIAPLKWLCTSRIHPLLGIP